MEYVLIAYDADGVERTDQDGPMSQRVPESVAHDAVSDVFIMGHGWEGPVESQKGKPVRTYQR